jgi:hypothetical protein
LESIPSHRQFRNIYLQKNKFKLDNNVVFPIGNLGGGIAILLV